MQENHIPVQWIHTICQQKSLPSGQMNLFKRERNEIWINSKYMNDSKKKKKIGQKSQKRQLKAHHEKFSEGNMKKIENEINNIENPYKKINKNRPASEKYKKAPPISEYPLCEKTFGKI